MPGSSRLSDLRPYFGWKLGRRCNGCCHPRSWRPWDRSCDIPRYRGPVMKSRNPPGLRATVVRCRPLAKIATGGWTARRRYGCRWSPRTWSSLRGLPAPGCARCGSIVSGLCAG